MADIAKVYGGGLQFSPSNDILLTTGVEFSRQRIIHRLLSAPVETDTTGVVTRPADDPFNQTYGAGLGRDVEGSMSPLAQEDQEVRIREALNQEPTVDQTQPITVQFGSDPAQGFSYVLIQCTTIDGDPVTVGLAL